MTKKRTKIGHKEIRVSPEYLAKLRARVMEVKTPQMSWATVAEKLAGEFKDVSLRTLTEHVVICGRATDYLFGLYADEKISLGIFSEIMRGNLDDSTRELLAKDVLRLGMTPTHISAFKKVVDKCDYATAINRAMGKIPVSERMEKARKSTRELVDLDEEIADLAFRLQSRILLAENLMPKTLLGSNQARAKIFKAVWDVVQAAKITVEFGEARIKRYLTELQQREQSEINLAEGQGRIGDTNERDS